MIFSNLITPLGTSQYRSNEASVGIACVYGLKDYFTIEIVCNEEAAIVSVGKKDSKPILIGRVTKDGWMPVGEQA